MVTHSLVVNDAVYAEFLEMFYCGRTVVVVSPAEHDESCVHHHLHLTRVAQDVLRVHVYALHTNITSSFTNTMGSLEIVVNTLYYNDTKLITIKYMCVCVFQCQPTALLRASGSAQGGYMALSVVYFQFTHHLGRPHYVWDKYLYSVLEKVEVRVTVCVTVCVV